MDKIKYVIDGQRDPDPFDYHCSMYKKEDKQMLKDELKEILHADVDKVDIHIDFNDSAVTKVNIQFKGITEQFDYEYEDTNVTSMKVNKIATQLHELGLAIVNKINKLAQAYGLVGSYKDWIKDLTDDHSFLKDANVRLNGKTVGKYISFHKTIDGNKLLNHIEIESGYEWVFISKPVRISITNDYGEIFRNIYGYLTEIRKQGNNKVSITIEQELINMEV